MLSGGGGNVRSIATVLRAKDKASGSLNRAESAGDDAADSMDNAEDSGRNLTRRFAMLSAATTAATGALGLLTRQHGPTEQMFAELGVVAADSEQQLENIRDTAINVGATMPVSIAESTGAMRELAFAGFEAEQAIEAVGGVAELATASSLDTSEAARTASSALNMFGIEAGEVERVTATMASTFSNSATTIREMSSAIEKAGATASMLGGSIEGVSATIGAMANQGIRAERAGTAINSMMTRLVSRSGQAEDAFNELGLSMDQFTNAEGELVRIDEMMTEIVGSLDDMDNRLEQVRVASELFGRRGARAVLSVSDSVDDIGELMENSFLSQMDTAIEKAEQFDGPREVIEKLEDSGMSTAEMAATLTEMFDVSEMAARSFAESIDDGETSTEELVTQLDEATTASKLSQAQLDTTAGSVDFLKSSFNALTFEIYSGAGPAIKFAAQRTAELTNWFGQNEDVANALGTTLAITAGALGLVTAVTGAQIAAASLATAVEGTLAGALLAKAGAAYTAAGGLAAMSVAGAPVWALGLALLALFGGLVAIWKTDFLGAASAVEGIFGGIAGAASWVASGIGKIASIGWELVKLFGLLAGVATLGPLALLLVGAQKVLNYNWSNIGTNVVKGIASGIVPDPIENAIGGTLSKAREFLPFSDAKRGPLSNLSGSGAAFIQTFAESAKGEQGTLQKTLGTVFSATPLGMATDVAGGLASGEGIGGAVTSTLSESPQGQALGAASDAAKGLLGIGGESESSSSEGDESTGVAGDQYNIEINQDIDVGDADATEGAVAEAARRGASELEILIKRLQRESVTSS